METDDVKLQRQARAEPKPGVAPTPAASTQFVQGCKRTYEYRPQLTDALHTGSLVDVSLRSLLKQLCACDASSAA